METQVSAVRVLGDAEHAAAQARHERRLDPYLTPHLARRAARRAHPVHDFLFTYYSYRPAQLRRWHPGFGVALHSDEHAALKAYAPLDGAGHSSPVAVSREYVASQHTLLTALGRLLRATATRPAHLGCFGMHEWAMVYRLTPQQVRHTDWSLRLGTTGTDAVVESHRVACSHFDAYRFFTPPAVGLNQLRPRAEDREDFEQPGCLHAGMDLYKHAFRLSPMICSDLVADCFELAHDIRELDMRAAPYDLSGLVLRSGEEWTPVRVETAEGKREYAEAQRHFAERGAPIRRALLAACDRLLEAIG